MFLAALLLGFVASFLPQTPVDPVATFSGAIGPADAEVSTPALARTVAAAFPARGRTFEFTAETSGVHRFELWSAGFKPYLIVRDARGTVLGEDEFSRSGILPRVTLELAAGTPYRIEAASRCGQPGAFRVDVFLGPPPPPDPAIDRAAALELATAGLAELEARGAPPDAELGTALHRLAFTTLFTGRVPEAIELFRRALAAREQSLGDHPLTAETCSSLAGVLQQTGDAAGATPLLERALAIDERTFGPNHVVTASAARALAASRELAGDAQAAEALYARALAIDESALGPDAKETLFVLSRLALLVHRRGDLASARALYERELEVRERLGGGKDPESARVLEALAAIHETGGEPTIARDLLERALARREATVGPRHADTAGTLAHLGVLLKALGEVERGAELVARAVAIDPNVYVPELVRQEEQQRSWNDRTTRWWQLVWVALSTALFALAVRRRRAGGALAKPWFAIAAVVSVLTYVNFGAFHFGSFVHRWDAYHYYLGAKYFDELRYDGLYDCTVIADQETPGWAERNTTRVVRDLATNQIVGAQRVLADADAYKRRFTPERWREFCADVAQFRDRESAERWEQTTTDHGFNATPVWAIAGKLAASAFPATDSGLLALAALDQLYLLALAAVLVWGFGWELAAFALAVFATYVPARFAWTGGGFLRWDWLFYTVASVCCLRRDRPWLAGLSLGYATLLRVFPGVLFVGPFLAWLFAKPERRRELGAPLARLAGGAALAAVVLVPASFMSSGGPSAWPQFFANTQKHRQTAMTNTLGLRTWLCSLGDDAARTEEQREDQAFWDGWRAARRQAWSDTSVTLVACAAAWLALFAFAVRGREPWLAAALAIGLVPIAFDLTSYYLAAIAGFALVAERSVRAGYALLTLSAATLLVSLAPFPWMTTWEDQQFAHHSLLTVLAFTAVLLGFVRRGRADAPADAPIAR